MEEGRRKKRRVSEGLGLRALARGDVRAQACPHSTSTRNVLNERTPARCSGQPTSNFVVFNTPGYASAASHLHLPARLLKLLLYNGRLYFCSFARVGHLVVGPTDWRVE